MDFKNVLIFGDSYSTFEGYIPKGFAVYYSESGSGETDVRNVKETWWHRLISETNSDLIQNNSWSGSTICYTGYNGDCSETSSFICRLNKLIDAGFFKENEFHVCCRVFRIEAAPLPVKKDSGSQIWDPLSFYKIALRPP